MDTKRKEKFNELAKLIGRVAIYWENIEYEINELICNHFISMKNKRALFIKIILCSGRFSFDDKLYCLRLISENVKNNSMQDRIDLILRFSYRFNILKNRLFNGKTCLPADADNIIKKIIADNYTYESVEVTDEYVRKAKSDISHLAESYIKIQEYFNGTIHDARRK